MKKALIVALCALFAVSAAYADDKTKTGEKSGKTEKKASQKAKLKTKKDKTSYTIGYNQGLGLMRNVEAQTIEINYDLVLRGLTAAFKKAAPELKEEEMREIMIGLQKDLEAKRKESMAKQQEEMKKQGEKNKTEGEAFLKENAKKEGVKVASSGLQYQVLAEGSGKKPAEDDTVTVNYTGTLIDGTEFDSSAKHGQPLTFTLNRVIKGWTEGLQLIGEGGKIRLFIPSELGYGERGAGAKIGPNAVLVFDIELLSVQAKPEETKSAPTGTAK